MKIVGVEKFSSIDFPKTPSFVVFTGLCNYNCWFCHNRQIIKDIADDDVLEMISKRRKIIEGVVISGGEPTLQPDLINFIKKVKELNLKVKIDTNGSRPTVLLKLIKSGYVDYVSIDYKCRFNSYYSICGNNANGISVRDSINTMLNYDIDWELRTTLIPNLDENELINMASEIMPVPKWVLKAYHEVPCIEKKPYTDYNANEMFSMVENIKDILLKYQPNMTILKK